MEILKIILIILLVIDCIVLIGLVLVQEGKEGGLGGVISGASESFWGQNKGRSTEGKLVLATRIAAILFLVLAVALNLDFEKIAGLFK